MLVNLDCQIFFGDEDILIDEGGSQKAVVGNYDDDVTLTFGSTTGKEIYMLNKEFAEKLGKALLEKAK